MQKVEIDLNEIIRLTDEKKTPEEIGPIFGVTGGVIRGRLKEIGKEPYRKVTKKSKELLDTIKQYLDEGYTNKQIATELHMSPTTVRKYTKEMGYETNSARTKTLTNKNITLTQEQEEVLYGSLLGDMSMDTNWKNARPIITHGGEQLAYFEHKCKIFKNLIGKPCTKDRYDKRTGKWYHRYTVKFLTNPLYTKIKEQLYPSNIKTITKEWLDKVTPRGIAYWFMDDGCNSGTIATNSFSLKECQLIVKWFKEKWNIECTLHKQVNNEHEQYLIYIKSSSRSTFYDLVIPYIIPSMSYKLENWNPKSCELRETPIIQDNPEPSLE